MRKTILALMLLGSVAGLQSCDKTTAPYLDAGGVTAGDQKVLVEDFTGHKCGNCPRASRAIYSLKAVYGDRLIIMAVHAGPFADVYPQGAPYYTYDFKNPVSVELDNDFGISVAGNPNGMVNRRTVNGSTILSSTSWADEVGKVLSTAERVPLKFNITTSYDSTTRIVSASVQTEFYKNLVGQYRICMYMTEDSIVNWQKDYDANPSDIPNYIHREVLRGSMNGTYGDVITPTSSGSIVNTSYTATLGSDWNDAHMSIITFIFDGATNEILQVEQTPVKK